MMVSATAAEVLHRRFYLQKNMAVWLACCPHSLFFLLFTTGKKIAPRNVTMVLFFRRGSPRLDDFQGGRGEGPFIFPVTTSHFPHEKRGRRKKHTSFFASLLVFTHDGSLPPLTAAAAAARVGHRC